MEGKPINYFNSKIGATMEDKSELDKNVLDNLDDELHYLWTFDEQAVLDFYKKSLDDLKDCLDMECITGEQYIDGVKDINWCVKEIFDPQSEV
jgi:hypothetical protein